jgi:histidinol-phosphate aminotransferase
MTNYANSNIRAMITYNPPLEKRRSYDGILLDFNERTIPVGKNVQRALEKFVKENKINIYPEYGNLCKKIAEYSGAKDDQVLLANGSDQGIDLVFRTFTKEGDKVVIPSPSFAMFYQSAEVVGCKILTPEYEKDLSFPKKKVLELLNQNIKLLVLCNPNNPTGTLIPLKDIEQMLKKALTKNTVVFIDEAYFEFSKVSAVGFIKKYPNLIITRTFSKAFGLGALRIGYVLSCKQNIEELLKVRGPYDVNMGAVVAAKAALQDLQEPRAYVEEVMSKAKKMVESFFEESGIEYFPSRANSILFRPKNSQETYEFLKDKGILTRPRKGANIDGTVRVTIGTVKQMKEFINKFKSFNQ